MNAAAKLAAFGVVLAATLGAGAAIGSAVGPIDIGDGDGDHAGGEPGHGDAEGEVIAELPAGGLLVAQDGYRVAAPDRVLDAGRAQPFSFTIEGPGGQPVETFDVAHERELHLIVASRDLTRFAHVHPTRDQHGTWTVELPPLPPGPYRAFADFDPAGEGGLTLGIDLLVPGQIAAGAPDALAERRTAPAGPLEVSLDGELTPGEESVVTLAVRRDGSAVTTEPYLGAAGHLVALRDGDLAYLHVHPLDDVAGADDPGVRFAVEVPSRGTYALFFDFVVDGELRTARFVVSTV